MTALRERRRILYATTALILVSTITDFSILGGVHPAPLAVRLVWAASTLAFAWTLSHAPGAVVPAAGVFGAVTGGSFVALVALTGGANSPLFLLIRGIPLLLAVVVQDYLIATWVATITIVVGGSAIVVQGQKPLAAWLITALAIGALAIYASSTYRRMRKREEVLLTERNEALQRALLTEEERQARRSAEEMVRERDAFLSIVAHELRTPLTSLVLHAQAANVPRVERQAVRLGKLIDTLLDASLLTQGRVPLVPEALDLALLAREVVDRLRPLAEGAGCAVELRCSQAPGSWDRLRLEQILENLISNAIKYGAGKPIEITVELAEGRAIVAVRDHGVGIAAPDHERIFRRFERAGTSTRGGIGAGLWVADQLVRAMGGRIDIDSAPGEGATFLVNLPP
jgi:signal transduction histidine kinase